MQRQNQVIQFFLRIVFLISEEKNIWHSSVQWMYIAHGTTQQILSLSEMLAMFLASSGLCMCQKSHDAYILPKTKSVSQDRLRSWSCSHAEEPPLYICADLARLLALLQNHTTLLRQQKDMLNGNSGRVMVGMKPVCMKPWTILKTF